MLGIMQGVIYSSTAAANYPSNLFDASLPYIPAKRLGYPEEVKPGRGDLGVH